MIEWALAAALLLTALALLPRLLRRTRAAQRKSGGSGVVIAIGMVLAMIYDPKAQQSTEIIQRKKEIGDSEAGESGDKPE
jgi:preprotein translocase subunit SecY